MKKKIVIIVSSNKGKIKEVKDIFHEYEVLSLKEASIKLGKDLIVSEDQSTHKDNALEKVRGLYKQVGDNYICIADDSWIAIDALYGFPGVHTARWMDADDHTKNLHFLEKMKNVKKDDRGCHYTTVIAIKSKDYEETFGYTLDGIVANECRGENGFGFDEIFELPNKLTLAEITSLEKYQLSPRKKALDKVRDFVNKNLLI